MADYAEGRYVWRGTKRRIPNWVDPDPYAATRTWRLLRRLGLVQSLCWCDNPFCHGCCRLPGILCS